MIGKRRVREWERRLVSQVAKLRTSKTYHELTLNRIKELVDAPNEDLLKQALVDLIADGKLRVRYRVVSPRTKVSLGYFKSPFDVPEELLDESTGELIEIDRFQNVEPVYFGETALAH